MVTEAVPLNIHLYELLEVSLLLPSIVGAILSFFVYKPIPRVSDFMTNPSLQVKSLPRN